MTASGRRAMVRPQRRNRVPEYYDPRQPSPIAPRHSRRQSRLSVALEALGGGFVIALLIYTVLALGSCASSAADRLAFAEPRETIPAYLINPEGDHPLDVHSVVGQVVVIDPPITAICRDGWTSYSQHRRGTCAGHRGVERWINRPTS